MAGWVVEVYEICIADRVQAMVEVQISMPKLIAPKGKRKPAISQRMLIIGEAWPTLEAVYRDAGATVTTQVRPR